MEKTRYEKLVLKYMPKEDSVKNCIVAFLVGGLVGTIGELLINFYSFILDIPRNEAGPYMIVTLVFLACFATALGYFDTLVSKAKAGLIIPITGFAHSMTSAALDYRKEGLVTGIGSNIFKLAGNVILYGVVSAYFFGLIRFVIFGG